MLEMKNMFKIQKPAQANSLWAPNLKNPITKKKKCWWSGSRCRPWVQAPVPQKERKKDIEEPEYRIREGMILNI
jgi:hypothetical protein